MLRTLLTRLKIFIRLHYSYPRSAKHKKIRSILPNTIALGNGVVIEKNVTFSGQLKSIGDETYIGENTFIDSCSLIGKFCSISRDVKIGLISHPKDHLSTSPVFYAPRRGWVKTQIYNEKPMGDCEIGNDVLVSAGCLILAGVKIGNGSIIGANSFVNADVPPYAIVAGSPARVTGYRFSDDIIASLQKMEWWNWNKEELLKLEDHFANVPEFIKASGKGIA